ncbi:MAG: hypothetical protein Q4D37_05730 [Oscillospiraceae bacterium]|nr:hypothetical protein [Oscillospiraceae bacterium]
MRYFPIILLQSVFTDVDILGNPISSLQPLSAACLGRWTEWTAEEIQLVGRDVTQAQRKILTDAPLEACKNAAAVRAGKEDYQIRTVKDLHGRWRLLYVERWRQTRESN